MKIIKNKIVIASHNEGKISEIKEIFNDFKYQVYSSKEFKLEEPEETGSSFEENALIKAKFTSKKTGFVSLSDDSGLCIDALNGEPGVYSARYAGKDKDFNLAMNVLQKKMINISNKKCKFVCALSLCWPNGFNITVRGEIFGNFVWPPRGYLGFGYDPIFQPLGMQETFAEINPKLKHAISHRSVAFQNLKMKINLS